MSGLIVNRTEAEQRAFNDGKILASRGLSFCEADNSDEARKAETLGVDTAFWDGFFGND